MPNGIDVSRWQGDIDWPAVASQGILWAGVRASVGAGYTDRTFEFNYDGAVAAGILPFPYHVVDPNNPVSDQLTRYRLSLDGRKPVMTVIDAEKVGTVSNVILRRRYVWFFRDGQRDSDFGSQWILYTNKSFAESQLKDGYQGFKWTDNIPLWCHDPNIKILTKDLLWVDAGSLEPGDSLVGFDEFPTNGANSRAFRPAEVTANGIRNLDCSKLHLSNGQSLIVSNAHPMLIRSGYDGSAISWMSPKEMSATLMRSMRSRPLLLTRPIPFSSPRTGYDVGYLAAAFDGEGSITLPNKKSMATKLTFVQRDNEMLEKVRGILTDFGYDYTVYIDKRGGVSRLHLSTKDGATWRFLMEMRPPRLLERWQKIAGTNFGQRMLEIETVEIGEVEPIGKHEIAALGVSTKTYISQGYASHNTASYGKNDGQLPPTPPYPRLPYQWTKETAWQYTSKGSILGISGAVDLDVMDPNFYRNLRIRSGIPEPGQSAPPLPGPEPPEETVTLLTAGLYRVE